MNVSRRIFIHQTSAKTTRKESSSCRPSGPHLGQAGGSPQGSWNCFWFPNHIRNETTHKQFFWFLSSPETCMCACALCLEHVFGGLLEHIRNQHMRKLMVLHHQRVVLLWWFGGSTERPGWTFQVFLALHEWSVVP